MKQSAIVALVFCVIQLLSFNTGHMDDLLECSIATFAGLGEGGLHKRKGVYFLDKMTKILGQII